MYPSPFQQAKAGTQGGQELEGGNSNKGHEGVLLPIWSPWLTLPVFFNNSELSALQHQSLINKNALQTFLQAI